MDRPPRRFVDELEDCVGEQGVGEYDTVGLLAHEPDGVEHVAGTRCVEQVAGERPAVDGEDGELLDRDGRQRGDS